MVGKRLLLCIVVVFSSHTAASTLLVVDFAKPLRLHVESEGTQLLLQLNQPIAPLKLSDRLSKLTREVAYYNEGYDRLLLEAQPGFLLSARADGRQLVISAYESDQAIAARQQQGRQALQRLQADVDVKNHRDIAAQQKLSQIYRESPTAENAFDLARQEEQIGRWPQALYLYQTTLGLAPERQRYIEPLASLQQGNRSRISYSYERIDYGSDEQREMQTWWGFFNHNELWRLGWEISRQEAEISQVTLLDGTTSSFSDDVDRLSLSMQWRYANYGFSSVDWFHSTDDGFGFRQQWHSTASDWALQMLYRQPEWEHPENLAQEGAVSGANISASHTFWRPDVLVDWETGYRLYDAFDSRDLARTLHVGLDLRTPIKETSPRLQVGYLFDGEYVVQRQRGATADGNNFDRLPLSSTETHRLNATAEGYLTDFIRYSGSLFYSWDRLGEAGPGTALKLDYALSPAVSLSLYANYSQVTDRSDRGDLYRLGSAVSYLF